MLSVRRLVVAFVAVTALFMGAGASAQAAGTFAPQTTTTQAGASAQPAWTLEPQTTTPQASSPWCSEWYATIPALRYRVCIAARTVTGGAWARSILQVVNITHTSRWIYTHAEMVVNGRVQPWYVCGKRLLPAEYVGTCTSPESFVVKTQGSYAYARGYVYDYSSGLGRWGYSPIYRP